MSNIKPRNRKQKYIAFRVKETCEYTHSEIKKLFNYDTEYITMGNPKECGYKNNKNMCELINDIINNSNYDLISVSEDAKSITYHFLGYED